MYVIVCEVACNLCVCKNFDSEQTQSKRRAGTKIEIVEAKYWRDLVMHIHRQNELVKRKTLKVMPFSYIDNHGNLLHFFPLPTIFMTVGLVITITLSIRHAKLMKHSVNCNIGPIKLWIIKTAFFPLAFSLSFFPPSVSW